MKNIKISHPFPPVFNAQSHVLILGTMPSPKSREMQFYYGHPRNRFWPALAALFGEPVPIKVQEREVFALTHGIALWDVLKSCDISGSSDNSIRNPEPNDLAIVLNSAPVRAIFCTGRKAAELYRKLILPVTRMEAVTLPSPSPANCALSFESLCEAYRVILDVL